MLISPVTTIPMLTVTVFIIRTELPGSLVEYNLPQVQAPCIQDSQPVTEQAWYTHLGQRLCRVSACVQDTKQVLAQLREADLAAKEQQDKVLALQTELASSHQQLHLAQQSSAELQTELDLQKTQQQHLLDELSQSQVCFQHACC